jgi:hypothetical protein
MTDELELCNDTSHGASAGAPMEQFSNTAATAATTWRIRALCAGQPQ